MRLTKVKIRHTDKQVAEQWNRQIRSNSALKQLLDGATVITINSVIRNVEISSLYLCYIAFP